MTHFYTLSADDQSAAMKDLATKALVHWTGEFHDITLLKYRENAVFSVRDNNGQKFALRIHRHAYHSDAELLSELQWMQSLGDAGLNVPNIIPTAQGELFVIVKADGIPEPRQIDMLSWLDGEPLGGLEHGLGTQDNLKNIYYSIGDMAADVHNHSVAWQLPDKFTRHAWDSDGLIGDDPFWGRFWELDALTDEQRQLLSRARVQAQADLSKVRKNATNYGLIHADFVPENLLHKNGDLMLIDFDDAGFGWHMFELATALYFHINEPFYPTIKDAILSGYRSKRPLSDEDEGLLPLFLLLRSFTYLGWVHTRSETETARELTPFLVDLCCQVCEDYLKNNS